MDLSSLALFVAVAHRGSFAAVARDRQVDPSSVSRAVAQLEDALGIRLLQRSTRRMTLTEAGERYLARVAPVLDDLDAAAEDARAHGSAGRAVGPSGTLRLTASVAFGQTCLVPLLPDLRARFPALTHEWLLTDTKLDLVGERIDLAVRLGPRPDVDAVCVKLFDTRYHVCASPAYLAVHLPPSTPAALAAHRCLRLALPEFRTRWSFRDPQGGRVSHAVDGDVVLSSPLAVHAAVRAGIGPALLPEWLVGRDLAAGRLVDLFPQFRVSAAEDNTAAWLLYPSRAHLPAKVRAVVDVLRARLGRSGFSTAPAPAD